MKNLSPDKAKPFPPDALVIRASRITDAEQLYEVMNMPGVRAGTLRPPFARVEQTKSFLESLGPNDVHIVAVVDGVVVGSAGLHRSDGRRRHVAGLGIAIHDDYTGRGIGTVLIGALVEAADDWLDIHRIELTVYTDNLAAITLYKKFNFEPEGIQKDYAFRNGAYTDVLAMARLRPMKGAL